MFNLFKKKKKRAKDEITESKDDSKDSKVDEAEAPAEEEAPAAEQESSAEPLASADETAGPAQAAAAEAAAAEAAAEEILSAEEAAGMEPVGATESVIEQEKEVQAQVEEPAVEEEVQAAEEEHAEEEEKEEEKEEEEKPRSMVTLVTLVLCVFNILAACAFAFLLLMDGQKRQVWEYASLVYDLVLWGVPLEEQDAKSTNSDVLHPPINLSQDQIAAEYKARKTQVQIPAKDFRDVNEVLKSSIKPSKLTKQLLTDLFKQSEGQPVTSLVMEVDRVRKKLLPDIEQAAKASAKSADALDEKEHRDLLKRILLPLAYNTAQVDVEAKRIEAAAAGDLKAMHEDAVQRSMLFELLDVLQMYRHWNVQEPIVTEIVGETPIALAKLKKLTEERIDDLLQERSKFLNNEKRAAYEKRDNIAFFLVAAANLRVPPDHKQLLYPRKQDENTKKIDPSRAEIVLGLVNYVNATNILASIYKRLDDQSSKRIEHALSGAGVTKDGKDAYVPGFESIHKKKQAALADMTANIEQLKKEIKSLQGQLESTQKLYEDDKGLSETMKAKLLAEKKTTAKLVADLKKLETQLFQAQLDLAGIMEVNQGLEKQITDAERKLKKKGK
jgi:hypothetical protein